MLNLDTIFSTSLSINIRINDMLCSSNNGMTRSFNKSTAVISVLVVCCLQQASSTDLASNANKRQLKFAKAFLSQIQRTPLRETNIPCFLNSLLALKLSVGWYTGIFNNRFLDGFINTVFDIRYVFIFIEQRINTNFPL